MMNFFKQVAGICVFVVAFTAAVALARFYGLLSAPVLWLDEVRTPEIARVAPARGGAREAFEVPLAARFVTLDFERRRSYTTLELDGEVWRDAPDKLRVWTYFFTPEGAARGEVWAAEPVELTRLSGGSDIFKLNAEAACSFCDDADAPPSGYYARVYVTTDSRPPVNLHAGNFDFDIKTASPVLVQATTARRRL
ncbi:MAG TPA: hypothetical protein VGV59_10300 [Pyrinomonadaceae bacterium]|nr:hypothetical protein [Pyrinomonadaceae bacterium]